MASYVLRNEKITNLNHDSLQQTMWARPLVIAANRQTAVGGKAK